MQHPSQNQKIRTKITPLKAYQLPLTYHTPSTVSHPHLSHSLTLSHPYSITPSLYHTLTYHTLSLYHTLTLSHPHLITPSLITPSLITLSRSLYVHIVLTYHILTCSTPSLINTLSLSPPHLFHHSLTLSYFFPHFVLHPCFYLYTPHLSHFFFLSHPSLITPSLITPRFFFNPFSPPFCFVYFFFNSSTPHSFLC